MATQVFDHQTWPTYSYVDELPVSIRMDGAPYEERRTKLADISRRRYSFQTFRTNDERQDVDDFLARARFLQYESFYVQDPRDDQPVTGISLGTADGTSSTYSLPSTGENRRFYPEDTGAVAYVDGSPASATVDTDARTVTFSSPPAMGTALTLDATCYRLCRLDLLGWAGETSNWFGASISIVEVREG